MRRLCVSFLLVVLLMCSVARMPVLADEVATPSADVVDPEIEQAGKERELLQLYQAQVESYREAERKYRISKAQYFKLNTLQSLEQTVVDTREVMTLRCRVLITYLELLHEILQFTPGIDLIQKAAALKSLEDQVHALRAHIVQLENTPDRAAIALRADEFEPIGAAVQRAALTAQGLVVIGRLQAVYDAAQSTYEDILKSHTEHTVSALKQAERERAYKEVTRQSKLAYDQLVGARKTFEQEAARGTPDTRQVVEQLNTVYTTTSQLLAFLKELVLKLTE